MEKLHKFNARYRLGLLRVAKVLGIDLISTDKQIEKGSLIFHDPIRDCYYGLYESGYVRRHIITGWFWGASQCIDGKNVAGYQLNKTKRYLINGRVATTRILANPDEQMAILVRSVLNYRNNK